MSTSTILRPNSWNDCSPTHHKAELCCLKPHSIMSGLAVASPCSALKSTSIFMEWAERKSKVSLFCFRWMFEIFAKCKLGCTRQCSNMFGIALIGTSFPRDAYIITRFIDGWVTQRICKRNLCPYAAKLLPHIRITRAGVRSAFACFRFVANCDSPLSHCRLCGTLTAV